MIKSIKIRINSDGELSLNKAMEILTIKRVVRGAFHENSKNYLQVLNVCIIYKNRK